MRRNIRKAGIVLGFAIYMSFIASCYATEQINVTQEEQIFRAEKTHWYLRVRNGVKQKRLWSLTHGCWKTNWTKY